MSSAIVVLNPNSTEAVTEALDRCLDPLRFVDGPAIECATLAEGPPGVESDEDVRNVSGPVAAYLARREPDAGAFVIACFSDPGLGAARARVQVPIFGMAESGYLSALTRGRRLGVISILAASVPRHRRYLEDLGLASCLAGDLPIELGVVELAQEDLVLARLMETGRKLRDDYGADVLVLGCAGMARYRARLEEAVALPIVEPVHAAVVMALGAVVMDESARGPLTPSVEVERQADPVGGALDRDGAVIEIGRK